MLFSTSTSTSTAPMSGLTALCQLASGDQPILEADPTSPSFTPTKETCSEETIPSSNNTAFVTLHSGEFAETATSNGDVAFSVMGSYHLAGSITPVKVTVRIPQTTPPIQIGTATFAPTQRATPSATHLVSVREDSICLRYRVRQTLPCPDLLNSGCGLQQSAAMHMSIDSVSGAPLPPGKLFVVTHSLGASKNASRIAWASTYGSDPPKTYTAPVTSLRKGTTLGARPTAWIETENRQLTESYQEVAYDPHAVGAQHKGVFTLGYHTAASFGFSMLLTDEHAAYFEDEICVQLNAQIFYTTWVALR